MKRNYSVAQCSYTPQGAVSQLVLVAMSSVMLWLRQFPLASLSSRSMAAADFVVHLADKRLVMVELCKWFAALVKHAV